MTDGAVTDREMCMDNIILGLAALIAVALISITAIIVIVPCLKVASDEDDKMGYG